ncbi:MAG: Lrp/AsnC family transcriptional regulator [Rhodobacteraceae bacterium]|nr:Lrp/AsnC family transcriptional regulator [Paracoccaceae bacterium]
MDAIDRKLLAALAENARTPVTTLAGVLGVARTTVQARLERLENSGVISGYTVRLGVAEAEKRIRATVLLQLDPRSAPAVVQRLRKIVQVEQAITSSGRFDLVLQIAARSTARLDEVLDEIGGIKGVRSSESLIQLSIKIDRGVW